VNTSNGATLTFGRRRRRRRTDRLRSGAAPRGGGMAPHLRLGSPFAPHLYATENRK